MRVHPAFILVLWAAMVAGPTAAATCDAVWRDGPRARDVPVRITLPGAAHAAGAVQSAGSGRVPAVIWSPGLGGGLDAAQRYVRAWAAAGIAVVRVQHPGTDGAVYAGDLPPAERAARVRAAVTPAQVQARIADIGFVLDELERRSATTNGGANGGANGDGVCDLARIDGQRLALAGHSMGAWVVQAMAGQRDVSAGSGGANVPAGSRDAVPDIDLRYRAFAAFSATGPADPDMAARAFGGIGRPLLVVTGTRDGVPAGAAPAEAARQIAMRSAPYAGAPADGRKALLVLADAGHMLFDGSSKPSPAQTALQDRAIAVTTLWWRRWLLGDSRAQAALARLALPAGDVLQRK